MTQDLRQLPDQVRARLGASLRSDVPNPGFDVHRGSRIVEARILQKEDSGFRVDTRASESSDTPDTVVRGYASVWGFEYDVYGGPPWGWTESVEQGSATKSIQESNVRFLFDHAGLPLGTTRGGTLALQDDKYGLFSELDPDMDSQYTREIVSRIDRGDIDSMSFAFRVIRQEWNDDYTRRWIREVQLFDVSAVNYPANPATVLSLSQREDPEDDEDEQSEGRSGLRLQVVRARLDLERLRATL